MVDDLISMTQRAAVEALSPELQQLRAENQQLRGMATRAQHAEIERMLDQQVPQWRQIYADPGFADWLAEQDDYSAATRSQLLRRAVAAGDSNRVVRFYQGFPAGAGQPQYRSYQSRQPATGAKRIYSREDIRKLYERRRKGEINDATWTRWEQEIFNAANSGRIAGALDKDGNTLSRLT
jgi:hypothetical protein